MHMRRKTTAAAAAAAAAAALAADNCLYTSILKTVGPDIEGL